jgi:hypothetical protein
MSSRAKQTRRQKRRQSPPANAQSLRRSGRTQGGALPSHLPRMPRLRGRLVQSPAPARLIEGGLSTEAKVSEVLVSKFADYLPLHRQARFYGRQGVCADETTAPVLDPARGRTKIGQLWTFARDDWPGADRIHPRSSMSTLQTGKRRSESRTLLASRAFSGRIYAGYRLLAEKGLCPTCFLLTARAAAVLRTRRRRPSADRK